MTIQNKRSQTIILQQRGIDMTADDRIAALRQEMDRRGIDLYIVPTSDFHSSEYVGEYFKERAYLTGFTGSAGTAVVTQTEAGLWTDGRYFVQAANQLQGTRIRLFPMGEPGVPKVSEYVRQHLPKEGCIGFDGRCMPYSDAAVFTEIAESCGGRISQNEDLVGLQWTSRPSLPAEPVWILTPEYAGETTASKLERIRQEMADPTAGHVISSLYDIAWILNLRGNDISHVPVFLSYLYITMTEAHLYANTKEWSPEVLSYLADCGVQLHGYDEIYTDLPKRPEQVILLDPALVNAELYRSAELMQSPKEQAGQVENDGQRRIVCRPNPSEKMRAIKNETEIANTRIAHIRDGVAVTKFICYIKKYFADALKKGIDGSMTEYDAQEILLSFRQEQPDFLDVSFDTISAYGPNGAMMHYSASKESCSKLKPEGFLLVDSGGHYLQGTTDVTRTIALGPLTDQMRQYFTLVLRCNLRLAAAHFPKGVCGQNLDVLARGPVWEYGLDYRCGTGHGVGHILNVHEGPNAFRWRIPEDGHVDAIEPGMITTDEPGLYVEGAFGIRTENELLCVEDVQTEYGKFYRLEPLTFVPIDLDAIDVQMLSGEEIRQLNAYHKQVYDTISPYLKEDERDWLATATRAV